MKKKTPTPISLRITTETRAQLDTLIERTGLKDAQLIRLAIFLMSRDGQHNATQAPATVAKPARKTR